MGGDLIDSRRPFALFGGPLLPHAWLSNTPVNADAQTDNANKSRKVGINEADDEEKL
jgi:hypothetical protein